MTSKQVAKYVAVLCVVIIAMVLAYLVTAYCYHWRLDTILDTMQARARVLA